MPNPREWMNNNPAASTITAIVILGIALAFIIWYNFLHGPGSNYKPPTNVYYYDLGSSDPDPMKHLFAGKFGLNPPIDTPSGGAGQGVLAFVWACGDCKKDPFIAYLQKYTPEAKKIMDNPQPVDPKNPGVAMQMGPETVGGTLISSDGKVWFNPSLPGEQDNASKLMSSPQERCKDTGHDPKPCYP